MGSIEGSILNRMRRMQSGENIVVIEDNGDTDISVRFPDGTVVSHQTKEAYFNGTIVNPNKKVKPTSKQKENKSSTKVLCSILGVTRMMNCGMTATVIADRGCNDIDIQFEDGTTILSITRSIFRQGYIRNPNYNSTSILGQERKMNNGQMAKVIVDRGCRDIDIQFEDGTIVCHRRRGDFLRGKIKNPNYSGVSRVGISRKMNNGQFATIIEDFGEDNITIQFEDGTLVYNKKRHCFRQGKVKNPNFDPTKILGQEKLMNNGQKAKVIQDNNSLDITVQFEDGTVVCNTTRALFRAGRVGNPNFSTASILGQEQVMNNGQKARVVKDEGCNNITVEFEDGTTVTKQRRTSFWLGSVVNPNYSPTSIVGLELVMRNGQKAKVIEDNGSKDITIKFEDGTVVRHKSRICFKRGDIKNPNYNPSSILGKERVMLNGLRAKVIRDNGCKDIDIEFEDGVVVTKQRRWEFEQGLIVNPNLNKSITGKEIRSSILNEEKVMNNGQVAKVIEDNGCDDITIQYEDGTILRHKSRYNFRQGTIENPNYNKYSILGMKNQMSNGQIAKVIEDNGAADITIEFEDGTVVKHCKRRNFKNGLIRNPNYNPYSILGKCKVMNDGQTATVIADRGGLDIDVQFEDGTVVTNRTRQQFDRGSITNPNYDRGSMVGLVNIMNNGQRAIVVEDNGCNDIKIQFEDGTELIHQRRDSFRCGNIANPNLTGLSLPQHIVYDYIQRYFPDAVKNYRPDWLKNPRTNFNLEIDIWIPSLKVGIEYDGVFSHSEETELSMLKYSLVCERDEIKRLYTILEAGTIEHSSPKHVNFRLNYVSKGVSAYNSLLKELNTIINNILHSLGVTDTVDIIEDVYSELAKLDSGDLTKERGNIGVEM